MERIDRAVERAGPDDGTPPHRDTPQPAGHTDHSRLHVVISHLHEILTTAPFVCMITDADSVIEYVNPRFEEATGYTREDVTGHKLTRISSDPSVNKEAWAALASGEGWRGEITYPRRDGSEYSAMASIQPLRSPSGELVRYFGLQIELTAQKRVEHQLAEREAYWQALLQSAPSYIGVIDRDGRIKSINRAAASSEPSEIEGTTAFDYLLPEYKVLWEDALRAVFERGETQSLEYAARIGLGGPVAWCHSAIGAVAGADGITEAVVVTTDLSERKQIEEALREREAYWRALIESAPEFIVTVDRSGTITSVNRELGGGRPEDAVARTVFDFAEESSHDEWREILRKVFEDGETVAQENRAALTSGEVRWWSYTVGPVKRGDDVVGGVIISHDITERKQAEERLRDSEDQWRALSESAPDYILVLDREGRILRMNRAVGDVKPEEVAGQAVSQYVADEQLAAWLETLERVFTTGEPQTVEVMSQNMGEPRWFADSIGPIHDGDTVKAVVVVARDITERRLAEERLRAFATAVTDLIVVVDREGVLHEVLGPPTGHGPLGMDAAAVKGTRIHDHLGKAAADYALKFVRQTIDGGVSKEQEIHLPLLHGSLWVHGKSAPLTLNDGREVAVVHISDITERKRLEVQLADLREEVEALAEERHARAAEFGLTFREQTVLGFIARGRSDKEIAELLGVSPFTVNKQSASATRKLGARSRSEAVARAVRAGII